MQDDEKQLVSKLLQDKFDESMEKGKIIDCIRIVHVSKELGIEINESVEA